MGCGRGCVGWVLGTGLVHIGRHILLGLRIVDGRMWHEGVAVGLVRPLWGTGLLHVLWHTPHVVSRCGPRAILRWLRRMAPLDGLCRGGVLRKAHAVGNGWGGGWGAVSKLGELRRGLTRIVRRHHVRLDGFVLQARGRRAIDLVVGSIVAATVEVVGSLVLVRTAVVCVSSDQVAHVI